MTIITPADRFAAAGLAARLETATARYLARRPSLVEGFPASYPAALVERARDLLARMAAVATSGGDARTDVALWADLVDFASSMEAAR